jgi:hypothetical protein
MVLPALNSSNNILASSLLAGIASTASNLGRFYQSYVPPPPPPGPSASFGTLAAAFGGPGLITGGPARITRGLVAK